MRLCMRMCSSRTIALFILLTFSFSARAAEQTYNFGGDFYSGDPSKTLSPFLGFHLGYATATTGWRRVNLVSRFELGIFLLGDTFGSQKATYNGIKGTWNGGIRFNFGSNEIIPFVELGPALGIFDALMLTPPANSSKNQASAKYGYFLGVGGDRYGAKGRGTGGWGIEVTYFHYFPSISMLEFPAAALSVTGVELDYRIHLPASR